MPATRTHTNRTIEAVTALERPVQQVPDQWLRGRVPLERIDAALDGAGGRLFGPCKARPQNKLTFSVAELVSTRPS